MNYVIGAHRKKLPRAPLPCNPALHLRPQSFETTFIWDHIHLRPHAFETTFVWNHMRLRPHSSETDHIHLRPQSYETTIVLDHIHLRSHSFYAMSHWTVLIYCESHFYDLPSTSLWDLTLSAETVAFVKITCQTFCSYAVAFLFKKSTKFFSCEFFDQCKRTFFSSFIFSWELKLLRRHDKGNRQEHKTCTSLT